MRAKLNVGPYPRGGDSYTVSATGGADNQTSGGSLKIIADTENWDNSLGLNNPGQSGDPASPHYRDLFEIWSRGKYFPIFYSRAKVESVTEARQMLAPRAASTAAPQGGRAASRWVEWVGWLRILRPPTGRRSPAPRRR